jgi:membrane protein implicated in regulation of membrane protease activity
VDEKEALLSQLKSVHIPEVSAAPAIGWWVLAVLCMAFVFLARWYWNRYLSRQWQREAAQELSRIREQSLKQSVSTTLGDTSRLARRILLAVKPREAVASLHGNDWLVALDEVCERPLFVNGFGKLLESGQYQRNPQVNPADIDALLDAMEELIRSAGRGFKRPSSFIDGLRMGA